MLFGKQIARQLRHPKGFLGRWLARKMNKANASLYHHLFSLAEFGNGMAVLEIGFGNGKFIPEILSQVQGGKVAGIETSETMFETASGYLAKEIKAGKATLKFAERTRIPFAAEHFDRVISINTIYFWPSPANYLLEILRVLRPGGKVLLGFRARGKYQDEGWMKESFQSFTAEDVTQLLENAGFEEIDQTPDPRGDEYDLVIRGIKPV
ncbi:MAG: class I SAM-dependent methyltransferase [Bacteroidia bacterium]|nr:class I SAM-dependent methyltransferase [Bacteroidia bacterium]